jgi:hypothetical protein
MFAKYFRFCRYLYPTLEGLGNNAKLHLAHPTHSHTQLVAKKIYIPSNTKQTYNTKASNQSFKDGTRSKLA